MVGGYLATRGMKYGRRPDVEEPQNVPVRFRLYETATRGESTETERGVAGGPGVTAEGWGFLFEVIKMFSNRLCERGCKLWE